MTGKHFNFGKNWQQFSSHRMSPERLDAAVASLESLVGAAAVREHSVLDIGCGSGLFSIAAAVLGASRITGFDISPESIEACRANAARFRDRLPNPDAARFVVGSILDPGFHPPLGTFDLVYAWGSLHHTGDMWNAIRSASEHVAAPGGHFALAIYNRHWSSRCWWWIKRLYNASPGFVQRLMVYAFGGVILLAKFAVTRRNPFRKGRGMDFWYDVIDWLGGYPYEYASREELTAFVESLGFSTLRVVMPEVPTGCIELVFRANGKCDEQGDGDLTPV